MKNRIICVTLSFLLCFMFLCSPVYADVGESISPFPDVPDGADYMDALLTLYMLGIFTGDENGNFNPNNTITRAETAKVICVLLGVGEEASSMTDQVFSDVPTTHWAVGYIAKASELGIVNGYGNGNFGPSDPVTYEQVVTMLLRAWGYEECAIEYGGFPEGYLKTGREIGVDNGVIFEGRSNAPRKDVAMFCNNILYIAPGDFSL